LGVIDLTKPEDIVALDEALTKLAAEDPVKAPIVNLLYFAGFSVEAAAKVLGVTRATVDRHGRYAKAWLYCELHGTANPAYSPEESPGS
jgi:hypothetical protein